MANSILSLTSTAAPSFKTGAGDALMKQAGDMLGNAGTLFEENLRKRAELERQAERDAINDAYRNRALQQTADLTKLRQDRMDARADKKAGRDYLQGVVSFQRQLASKAYEQALADSKVAKIDSNGNTYYDPIPNPRDYFGSTLSLAEKLQDKNFDPTNFDTQTLLDGLMNIPGARPPTTIGSTVTNTNPIVSTGTNTADAGFDEALTILNLRGEGKSEAEIAKILNDMVANKNAAITSTIDPVKKVQEQLTDINTIEDKGNLDYLNKAIAEKKKELKIEYVPTKEEQADIDFIKSSLANVNAELAKTPVRGGTGTAFKGLTQGHRDMANRIAAQKGDPQAQIREQLLNVKNRLETDLKELQADPRKDDLADLLDEKLFRENSVREGRRNAQLENDRILTEAQAALTEKAERDGPLSDAQATLSNNNYEEIVTRLNKTKQLSPSDVTNINARLNQEQAVIDLAQQQMRSIDTVVVGNPATTNGNAYYQTWLKDVYRGKNTVSAVQSAWNKHVATQKGILNDKVKQLDTLQKRIDRKTSKDKLSRELTGDWSAITTDKRTQATIERFDVDERKDAREYISELVVNPTIQKYFKPKEIGALFNNAINDTIDKFFLGVDRFGGVNTFADDVNPEISDIIQDTLKTKGASNTELLEFYNYFNTKSRR